MRACQHRAAGAAPSGGDDGVGVDCAETARASSRTKVEGNPFRGPKLLARIVTESDSTGNQAFSAACPSHGRQRRRAESRYSARSATVGCTRNARRVGTMHASMQTPNIAAA